MFPTAALLVALRLGACPASHDVRWVTGNTHYFPTTTEKCCPTGQQTGQSVEEHAATCYLATDHCEVADETRRCCALQNAGTQNVTACFEKTEATCTKTQLDTDWAATGSGHPFDDLTWCPLPPPPPAPPPPSPPPAEELSSGAIGGIVVGAYLGVAAIGGAAAAYRGIATA